MELSNANVAVPGSGAVNVTPGTAGLNTQVGGQATTVNGAAGATGGIAPGNFIETDIDRELFQFENEETPLMQLMLGAKRVNVTSPVVQHFSIDQPRASAVTTAAAGTGKTAQVVLPVESTDQLMFPPYTTILVKGVDGYDAEGKNATPGKDLMLFVSSTDGTTSNPVVRAVNGPKTTSTDESCNVPTIPAGTTLIVLGNAMYETQEHVQPDLIVPQPQLVYCQKRGLTNIVSDYFAAQAKRLPFAEAIVAEAMIRNFKVKGNRTLWSGRAGKLVLQTALGPQTVYTTEGVRYMIRRQLQHHGKWSYEQFIALAKMVFTGNDVPKSVVVLGGKGFIENIQCIDFSKHPEVQIQVATNEKLGWTVTRIHTIFGDLEFKHEPALNYMGWSNSAAVIAPDRLVHYVYSQEHKLSDKVDGHEAKREATLVWDALALKGNVHIWIDGEATLSAAGKETYELWESASAPENPATGKTYVLLSDCPGIDSAAVAGTMWRHDGTSWKQHSGEYFG